MTLYHVSDSPAITRFEPRAIGDGPPLVWAIDADHLCNYLLPRECPRVCFRGPPETALLAGARIVISIEVAWEDRVRTGSVAVYEMPDDGFQLADAVAGYWTSAEAVMPVGVRVVEDLPAELAARGVRLVVLPSLWELADRVKASGLDFSLIRMRNAGGEVRATSQPDRLKTRSFPRRRESRAKGAGVCCPGSPPARG